MFIKELDKFLTNYYDADIQFSCNGIGGCIGFNKDNFKHGLLIEYILTNKLYYSDAIYIFYVCRDKKHTIENFKKVSIDKDMVKDIDLLLSELFEISWFKAENKIDPIVSQYDHFKFSGLCKQFSEGKKTINELLLQLLNKNV